MIINFFSKLLSETVKQEHFEDNNSVQGKYSITKPRLPTSQSKQNNIQQTSGKRESGRKKINNLLYLGITSILRNPRDTINGLSAISMSMANIGGHLMPTLNASHLPNGTGSYFVSGIENIFITFHGSINCLVFFCTNRFTK